MVTGHAGMFTGSPMEVNVLPIGLIFFFNSEANLTQIHIITLTQT